MKQYAYLGNSTGVMRLGGVGTVYFNTNDIGMVNVLMNDHVAVYEPDVVAFMEEVISPGSIVFDVGANVGIHAVRAARIMERRGVVYALEPNPIVFANLKRNVSVNGMASVIDARRKAAWSSSGQFEFSYDTENHRVGRIEQNENYLSGEHFLVEAVSIDEAFDADRNRNVVFKIDVEGGEQGVLTGAAKTIEGTHKLSIIFELNITRQNRDLSAMRWLKERGFSFHVFDAGIKPVDADRFQTEVGHFNLLATKTSPSAS